MDLRGGLQAIRTSLTGTGSEASSSAGSIEVIQQKEFSDIQCKECDTDQCAVCLERTCNTMLLPCCHQFHADCIIQWTSQQFSCPLCRTEVSHFVPLRSVNSELQNDFVKIWERHYIRKSAVPKAEDGKVAKTVHTPLKRAPSLAKITYNKGYYEPPIEECKHCTKEFNNGYIYLAFDHKFCSTQCRLHFARSNKTRGKDLDDGTTSFYVDHAQIKKYLAAEARVSKEVST